MSVESNNNGSPSELLDGFTEVVDREEYFVRAIDADDSCLDLIDLRDGESAFILREDVGSIPIGDYTLLKVTTLKLRNEAGLVKIVTWYEPHQTSFDELGEDVQEALRSEVVSSITLD